MGNKGGGEWLDEEQWGRRENEEENEKKKISRKVKNKEKRVNIEQVEDF